MTRHLRRQPVERREAELSALAVRIQPLRRGKFPVGIERGGAHQAADASAPLDSNRGKSNRRHPEPEVAILGSVSGATPADADVTNVAPSLPEPTALEPATLRPFAGPMAPPRFAQTRLGGERTQHAARTSTRRTNVNAPHERQRAADATRSTDSESLHWFARVSPRQAATAWSRGSGRVLDECPAGDAASRRQSPRRQESRAAPARGLPGLPPAPARLYVPLDISLPEPGDARPRNSPARIA